MKLRSFLLAATILAVPAIASAQPITGLYIGAGAGGNYLQNEAYRASPGLGTGVQKQENNLGPVGVGSIGYGFGNGFRMEIEGDYRYNNASEFHGTAFPTTANGNEQQYGVMVNALYDFDIGLRWMYPYVGVGGGYGWTEMNGISNVGTSHAYSVSTNSTYGSFAYQGIVGAAFPIQKMPGLSLTAEYRYYGQLGPQSFHGVAYNAGNPGGKSTGNLDFRNATGNSSVLLGIRYAFNTPKPMAPMAPMPVAAPAPAPARTYLVFFDWDRADLTARARQIIAEAAQSSTHVQYTRIQVNGYTDLSGSPAYNQGLSVRRAQSVAAELVRDGVPRTSINIQGFGESHPLVPTAQGVREPQNRRVEIIIQ